MDKPWDIPEGPDVVIGRYAWHKVNDYDMLRRVSLLEYFEFLGWVFVVGSVLHFEENWIFRKG